MSKKKDEKEGYIGNSSSSGVPTTSGYIQTYPQRSSSCPHCTPRCPHGYPLDSAPWQYPTITWTATGNTPDWLTSYGPWRAQS